MHSLRSTSLVGWFFVCLRCPVSHENGLSIVHITLTIKGKDLNWLLASCKDTHRCNKTFFCLFWFVQLTCSATKWRPKVKKDANNNIIRNKKQQKNAVVLFRPFFFLRLFVVGFCFFFFSFFARWCYVFCCEIAVITFSPCSHNCCWMERKIKCSHIVRKMTF